MTKYRMIELTDHEIANVRAALTARIRQLNDDHRHFQYVEEPEARDVLLGSVRSDRSAAASAYAALDSGVYGVPRAGK